MEPFELVNFEDELIEVIRNACPEGQEEPFQQAAIEYWGQTTVADVIRSAFED